VRDTSKYVIDGTRWPSVTEVLEIVGLSDWSRVSENVLEFAAQRGRDVHATLQGIDTGVLEGLTPDPRVQPYVDGYLQFREDKGFVPDQIEQVVVNPTYMYVGTLDRTGTMEGERWLLDFKAVTAVQPEAALQTAGYEACLAKPHRRGVLQLKSNGRYRLHTYKSRNDLHDFLSAVRIAHWKLRYGRVEL
jgi:hypothetical protein